MPLPVRPHARLSFVLGMGLALAGCGGAGEAKAPATQERSRAEEPEPRSIEEAEAQIARARADLGGGAAPADASPPRPKTPGGGVSQEERAPTATSDACASPCRALASMRRAVQALCRMTGDEDTRCVDAKRTLADSTTRTSTCSCP
jgi:hypothetical protein